jgi:hypothetical protein
MSQAKNLGRRDRDLRKILGCVCGGVRSTIFITFYCRFVKVSRIGQTISKNSIFDQIFSFLVKTILSGGTRLRIFKGGVKAMHPHPLQYPPGIMYGVIM